MNIRTSLLASAISLIAATPALANGTQLGFDGVYAPANWTFSNTDADGSVVTTVAPNSITITGGKNNSGLPGTTDYVTTAAATGEVKFNWSYSSGDTVDWDNFGYLLNGIFSQLAQMTHRDLVLQQLMY
ncbi:MAG: hypothetical protein ACKOPT_10500 [Cyanobium sp.]